MYVQLVSEAAPGRAENEDLAFHHGDLVGVLDGVSAPAGVESGCVHGPAWYVRRLAGHLQHTAAGPRSLVDGLSAAIKAVRGEHGGRCDLDHPSTPAATVALVRAAGGQLDYLVLCDSHIVLDLGDRVEVITDERFGAAVADVRRAALTGAAIGSAVQQDQVRQAAVARQRLTNRPGGYWIAAAMPEAAHHAVTGSRPLSGPGRWRRAVLLTDGASCSVERFGLLDWRGLLDLVSEHGPGELIRRVRAAENADSDGRAQPRYKRHDDATVALCRFGEH
jgi:hypothetical protein